MEKVASGAIWQSEESILCILSPVQQRWLLDNTSLTRRLRQITQGKIEYLLKWQGWSYVYADECLAFSCHHDIDPHQGFWIREIEWRFQDQLWIKGRVVIPSETRRNVEGQGISLATSIPLGDILFQDTSLERSPIRVACLAQDHPYYSIGNELRVNSDESSLLARRSIFYFYGWPLLVAEIFLPAFFKHSLSNF